MRGIAQKTKDLIEFAYQVLEEIQPAGLRALHYAIFSRQEIEYENDKSSYRRLSSITTYARRLYREWELHGLLDDPPEFSIPPDWMTDETRALEKRNVWEDAAEYAECIKAGYRRDNWKTQPRHVEVWSEKQTIVGSIRPVLQEWGVGLRVCHGYSSTGMEMDVAHLFEDVDKPITVFYLGDADPSGFQMQEDIHQRVMTATGKRFEMRRLAIFLEDIKRFHLPPQRIKPADSRSAGYRREHGDDAPTVELDALPPTELRHRIESSIKGLIDFDDWDRQVKVQQEELKCIVEFADKMKNLPPPPSEAPAATPETASTGKGLPWQIERARQVLETISDVQDPSPENLVKLREAASLYRDAFEQHRFNHPCARWWLKDECYGVRDWQERLVEESKK
jgi:hypothetical protein